jgi:phosphocarrier protein HPr
MTEVQVVLPVLLHARPAALIVRAASKGTAQVSCSLGDRTVEAKSLLGLLSLGAPVGATLTLRAEGTGAAEAVAAVQQAILGLHV